MLAASGMPTDSGSRKVFKSGFPVALGSESVPAGGSHVIPPASWPPEMPTKSQRFVPALGLRFS